MTKVLSTAPQHALAHMLLGVVQIQTNREAQGIAECQQALALDRNLADAHGCIGMAKNFMGRAEETEAHIQEALRLSPRDIFASRWMVFVGYARMQLGADAEAVTWLRRSIEANRNFPFPSPPKGNKNAFRHGHYTAGEIARRRKFAELIRTARELMGADSTLFS